MKIQQLFMTLSLVGLVLCVASFDGWSTRREIIVAKLENTETTFTSSLAQFVTGFGQGLYDYTVEVLRCLKQLVLHPVASLNTFIDAVYHYDETYDLVKTAVVDVLKTYPHMSISEKARLQTIVFSEIISIFTPTTISFRWTKKAMDRMRKASAIKRFDPVSAAEWFASEGQPAH